MLDDLRTGRSTPALAPAMAAPPRLYVGGRGEPALRRAARVADAWMPMWLTPARSPSARSGSGRWPPPRAGRGPTWRC